MVPELSTKVVTVGSNGLAVPGRGRATFVAFAPNGISWFIRYSTKLCLWGPNESSFPSTWQSLVDDLERNHPRKDECIEFVAFGLHDILLVRFENGNSQMILPENPAVRSRISAELIQEVKDRLQAGWTLGNRTTLCAFDTNRWFIEWKRGSSAVFAYNMGTGEAANEEQGRVQKVLSGVGSDAGLVASEQNAQLVGSARFDDHKMSADYDRFRQLRHFIGNVLLAGLSTGCFELCTYRDTTAGRIHYDRHDCLNGWISYIARQFYMYFPTWRRGSRRRTW